MVQQSTPAAFKKHRASDKDVVFTDGKAQRLWSLVLCSRTRPGKPFRGEASLLNPAVPGPGYSGIYTEYIL